MLNVHCERETMETQNNIKKLNRRQKKTENMLSSIRQTLIKKMQTQKLSDISVADLAEEVDISRSTFYLHYQDIFSVIEEIADIEIQRFNTILKNYEQINSKLDYQDFLVKIFEIFEENSNIYITLLGPNGDITFINKIRDFFRENIIHAYKEYTPDWLQPYNNYSQSFYFGGLIALIENWIRNGMKESVEDMARIVISLITFDIQQYLPSENKLNFLKKMY